MTCKHLPLVTLLLALCACDEECGRGVHSGDAQAFSVFELEKLEGYTAITGALDIECSDCVDLAPLYCLEQVEGNVAIHDSASLAGLEGLGALASVAYLDITGNPSLTSLVGLDSLAQVGGDLTVSSNPALTSLGGLDRLVLVGVSLGIFSNPVLTDLGSLSRLTEIEDLVVQGNGALTSLAGLGGIAAVRNDLMIQDNDSLESLDGLDNIESVGHDVRISGNPGLASLDGMGSLAEVSSYLLVADNDGLATLDGLDALTEVGWSLGVRYNAALPDCEVCELIDQLSSLPDPTDVYDNLDDSCTPVPTNCP